MLGIPSVTAIANIFNISNYQTTVMVATSIALGAIYSLDYTKKELRDLNNKNPYSTLALLGKDLETVAVSKAYNSLEEYIND